MKPNNRDYNWLALIAQDPDATPIETPKTQREYYLKEIAANVAPNVVATFETTVSPAATKCDKKYADLQAAVKNGKIVTARVKGSAPVLTLVSDGGADGPMVWQADVWGTSFNATTGPASHTYYRCTLTKADVATIENT